MCLLSYGSLHALRAVLPFWTTEIRRKHTKYAVSAVLHHHQKETVKCAKIDVENRISKYINLNEKHCREKNGRAKKEGKANTKLCHKNEEYVRTEGRRAYRLRYRKLSICINMAGMVDKMRIGYEFFLPVNDL